MCWLRAVVQHVSVAYSSLHRISSDLETHEGLSLSPWLRLQPEDSDKSPALARLVPRKPVALPMTLAAAEVLKQHITSRHFSTAPIASPVRHWHIRGFQSAKHHEAALELLRA